MSLTNVPFPGFAGGLNLRDQPNQVDPAQAVDLLNVSFIEREGVRSRDGYAKFTSVALTNRPDSMSPYYTVAGTTQLVVGNGLRLDALSTGGASAANVATTASPHYFARFGGPTAELLFISNGTDTVRQWNGTAFSTPTFTGTAPTGRFVAVAPWDNRLVNARRGGATGGDNPSTVRFSDPGVPTTFGANNFVDVTPGDGEQITGIIAWSRYLFVFKETKFFRFYGTSTGAAGTPIFLYETVDVGLGAVSPRAICAARDGVYFLSRNGVYRTQGSDVRLVSPTLEPFFLGATPDFFTAAQPLNHGALTQAAMAFHREQIYLAVPTGSSAVNNRVLVYDPRYDYWTLYDLPAAAMASFRVGTQPDLMFAYAAGSNDVGRHTTGQTTDAGTAISSRWVSGWWNLGVEQVKTVRESLVWGKGKIRLGLGYDFQSPTNIQAMTFQPSVDTWADGTNAADKWGDGTNAADKWSSGQRLAPLPNRAAVRGTVLNLNLQNADSTPWAIYRMTARLRDRATARAY